MPNWCEGNIRFRGKLEDILRMLKNELKYCYYDDERNTQVIGIDQDIVPEKARLEGHVVIAPPTLPKLDSPRTGWWYWNETRRAFPNFDGGVEVDFWSPSDDEKDEWIAFFPEFKQAWGVEVEDWVRYSQDYNLDVRIFAWECGMEFGEDIEIIKGDITKCNGIHYDNWGWDCPMPTYGG